MADRMGDLARQDGYELQTTPEGLQFYAPSDTPASTDHLVPPPANPFAPPEAVNRGVAAGLQGIGDALSVGEAEAAPRLTGAGTRLGDLAEAPLAANANVSQAQVKAMLPPPLSANDRIYNNYVRALRMTPDEMLSSEPVWSTAANLAEQTGMKPHEAFAQVANDMFQRMGANRFMTPQAARLHMAKERGVGVVPAIAGGAVVGGGLGMLPDEARADTLIPPERSPAAVPRGIENTIGRGLKAGLQAVDQTVGAFGRQYRGENRYGYIPDETMDEKADRISRQAMEIAIPTAFGEVFYPRTGTNVGGSGFNVGAGVIVPPKRGITATGGLGMPPQSRALVTEPTRQLASPEEITRAAAVSRQGITQPELRTLYGDLGLTGRPPSPLVLPSLRATQPEAARQTATDLKFADRAALDKLTPEQRQLYVKGKYDITLPSQEAAAPALAAFAPIKKEVGRAEKAFDANVARGIKPSLFDLSPQTLRQVPDVPQFPLPRVAPEMTERLASVQRGGMGRIERAAAQAPAENWGWYNLMQMRDYMHSLHGPQRGEQAWNAWLDSLAGTSMVNPIDNNVRSSTWYLQQALQGKPFPEIISLVDPKTGKTVQTMAGGPPPGYGAKSQIQHAARVNEYMTHSYDPVSNPKPISYRMDLSGNWVPRTVDTHDIRNLVGMPRAVDLFGENAGLLPKEYSYLEDVGGRAAQRAGSTQAAQQAATWIGGGEYTGLKSYPAPLQEVINRRAHVTAQVYGITPEQALRDAFTGVRPLLGLGGTAVMGGLAAQNQYDQR